MDMIERPRRRAGKAASLTFLDKLILKVWGESRETLLAGLPAQTACRYWHRLTE
jgi:hypothetical protein